MIKIANVSHLHFLDFVDRCKEDDSQLSRKGLNLYEGELIERLFQRLTRT